MTKYLMPTGGCRSIDYAGTRYEADRGGRIDVSDDAVGRALRTAAEVTPASLTGTVRGGYRCTACGFGAYFTRCSRCGETTRREE